MAEASVAPDATSLLWLSDDTLLVGSSGNTELQILRLHSDLGETFPPPYAMLYRHKTSFVL